MWQYYNKITKRWVLMRLSKIEEAYLRYKRNEGDTDVLLIKIGKSSFMIDYSAMKRTNIETGLVQKIRRL